MSFPGFPLPHRRTFPKGVADDDVNESEGHAQHEADVTSYTIETWFFGHSGYSPFDGADHTASSTREVGM